MPSPCGKRLDVELRRIRLVLSADAFTNTTRAPYSVTACVFASMTRTPDARPVRSSWRMECTTESGRRVRFPVFAAHGSVDAFELK